MKRKISSLKKIRHNPVICIIIILIASAAYYYQLAETSFSAEVISVIDGDTVDVLVIDQTRRIRLAEIDAPEKSQPFGNKAKQVLIRLVKNKTVTITPIDKDKYQRIVAVIEWDNININREMVRLGMAWVYTSYNTDKVLPLLEAKARANKLGVWQQANPIPPWRYRQSLK